MTQSINLNHIDASPLPDEVKALVGDLLEGRLRTLIILAEDHDGKIYDGIYLDLEGGETNHYAIIGALDCLKDDVKNMSDPFPFPMDFDDDDDDDDRPNQDPPKVKS